ncbi:maltose/maltodextrin ABC transporter [Klebsiella pneumoniae subsp. pneumoniae]|nr:maltose/maltodextrin ABC transporter [Klebsiella pneumoniae subsp. pneumoniae]
MSIHSSENFSDARGPGRHAWCGLLLAIVPGFGQFYHRQWLKGLVFLVLLSSFLGIFYDFLREGLWGLYTLGEEVPRDNSIFLLAEGIISVLIVAFGVLIYFLSLRDAWLNGKKRDEGIALNSVRKQYQMLLSDGFPYLMITPGLYSAGVCGDLSDSVRFRHRLHQLQPVPHPAGEAGGLGGAEKLY